MKPVPSRKRREYRRDQSNLCAQFHIVHILTIYLKASDAKRKDTWSRSKVTLIGETEISKSGEQCVYEAISNFRVATLSCYFRVTKLSWD